MSRPPCFCFLLCIIQKQPFALRRDGETGRRARLKISYPPGCVGSIPTLGTIFFFFVPWLI